MKLINRTCLVIMVLCLAACGGIERRDGPGRVAKAAKAPQVIPKREPLSKYGNPSSYVVFGKRYHTLKTAAGFKERGIASWYGKKFHGRKTSSGEMYDMYKMTAAHKHLPLPTYVKVKNLENGKTITVRVNDRGPFHDNRIIDLSYAAATKLGILGKGTAPVEVWAFDSEQPRFVDKTESDLTLPNKRDLAAIGTPQDLATKVVETTAAVIKDEASLEKLIVDELTTAALHSSQSPIADIYLQIGAYRDIENARVALARVLQYIPMARIQEASASGGATIYRVQIGPIGNAQQADHYVQRLLTLGFSDHHLISP